MGITSTPINHIWRSTLFTAGSTALLVAPLVVGMMMVVHPVPLRAQQQPQPAEVSPEARNTLNKGVSAFRAKNYQEASQFFNLNPAVGAVVS